MENDTIEVLKDIKMGLDFLMKQNDEQYNANE